MNHPMNRREFLGAGATAGALLAAGPWGCRLAPPDQEPAAPLPVRKIRKVYLAKPVPTWPKPDLDIPAEIAQIERHLAEAERRLGDIQFVGGELLRVPADAAKVTSDPGGADGALLFNLTSGVGGIVGAIAETGIPTALFSRPYAGHDWSSVAGWRKQGLKIFCCSTSDTGEIDLAARILCAPARLKESRALCVRPGGVPAERAAACRRKLGPEIVSVEYRRLKEEYDRVDEAEAAADAERWIRGAVRVVEPSREEVVRSSRLYLAMRRLMKQEGALAVTIDCLGGFRRQELPAYPCLGFCRLNDLRRVGACEADLDSMLTMLLFAYAFGVPGFISDPVIDTSANEVIHAHCVSPTRMDGPAGPPLPYLIRSHMEDDRGAALQVRHRVGETITSAKIVNFETVLISTGKITANVDADRGCRTKIATKVPRARTLLDNYGSGLHRVIFYGDRREGVGHLAALLGLKIAEEA